VLTSSSYLVKRSLRSHSVPMFVAATNRAAVADGCICPAPCVCIRWWWTWCVPWPPGVAACIAGMSVVVGPPCCVPINPWWCPAAAAANWCACALCNWRASDDIAVGCRCPPVVMTAGYDYKKQNRRECWGNRATLPWWQGLQLEWRTALSRVWVELWFLTLRCCNIIQHREVWSQRVKSTQHSTSRSSWTKFEDWCSETPPEIQRWSVCYILHHWSNGISLEFISFSIKANFIASNSNSGALCSI